MKTATIILMLIIGASFGGESKPASLGWIGIPQGIQEAREESAAARMSGYGTNYREKVTPMYGDWDNVRREIDVDGKRITCHTKKDYITGGYKTVCH